MYRVGIVINENEVAHSKYADTLETLRSAIEACNQNGSKGNSFNFSVFDKFNIQNLFGRGDQNIMTFDGLVVATNAMGYSEKIHNLFCNNKQSIEEFINRNKGMFISSQKKLSNGSLLRDNLETTGFLPDIYDYFVFDRPEKYSADGEVSISAPNKVLLYPYLISNELIKNHCENNQFIIHKYRSLIIPKHANSYETLLRDTTSAPISHKQLGYLNGDRKVLLCGRNGKRIVISTMALDWANHSELLCNILTYITEDKSRAIFVKKDSERVKSTTIDSYIIRANIANIPYRVISGSEIDTLVRTPGNVFIFSPNWLADEIEGIYAGMLARQSEYFSIYHIDKTNVVADKSQKLSKYCNFSSVDIMRDSVVQNLLSSYLSTSWNRSVWTYSYVLRLGEFFGYDIPQIVKKVYEELGHHFTKTDDTTGKTELTGNYDNVFNATCKLLEILCYFQRSYSSAIRQDSPYMIGSVIEAADNWILAKVEAGSVFDQDICYCLLYLVKNGRYGQLKDATKAKLTQLLMQLLTSIIEEILSRRIDSRSSIDLCRIYQTLCMLTMHRTFTAEKTITYLDQIEEILKERQDVYGNWKNVSETAEITAMLLEVYELRSKLDTSTNTFNTLITKGIESLYSQFDSGKSMWGLDLGTTAKAMYAIGVYDKIYNFAINDFFVDLKNSQETRIELTEELTVSRIGDFYKAIDALEERNEDLSRTIMASERKMSSTVAGLKKIRNLSSALVAAVISLVYILAVVLAILSADHRDVLLAIVGGWQSYLIDGFFALLITVGFTFLYSVLTKKAGG